MSFSDLKVGVKLSILTAFMLALLGGIGTVGLLGLKETHTSLETLYLDRVIPLEQLKSISDLYAVEIVDTAQKIHYGQVTWLQGSERVSKAQGRIGEIWKNYLATHLTAEEKRLADAAAPRMQVADRSIEKLQQILRSSDRMALMEYVERELYTAIDPVSDIIGELVALQLTVAQGEYAASDVRYRWALSLVIGGTLLGIVVALALSFVLIRGITRPIGRVVGMVEQLNAGNLDIRVNLRQQDEIGRLGHAMDAFADGMRDEILTAFNRLADGDFTFQASGVIRDPLARANAALNEAMGQVQVTAEEIATGASQVSDASQSLSQGATEQASSLEEITSSLSELATQTKVNAENAGQANLLSSRAREAAEEGNRQMKSMVEAMGGIREASQSISRIIKTIDEIAFQTNLLALNAAVEAARAGQHGKGFAVVAEEVRNLAARSAKAARETADLIEGSVRKSETGAAIAAQTESSLEQIVAGITKAADLVSEIAAASSEQAEGIGQINQGLGQIDQVTQQNTANAEESAAAAEELSGQADELRRILARFTLSRDNKRKYSPTTPPKPRQVSTEWGGPSQKAAAPSRPTPSKMIALDDAEFGRF